MERILIGPGDVPASEILIEPGAVTEPRPELFLPDPAPTVVAILTQPGRPATYARGLRRAISAPGIEVELRTVPDGEAAKTLPIAEEVFLWLNDLAMTRDGLVIGVGGGAVTDLAGFVAAVYLRGVSVVQIPTTLLAAVDAAVGGKSGVNVGGKNLVGAFRHPARVVVDPLLLAGLPDELVAEGSAEALKSGLIGDPELVALYEAHGLDAPLEEVVVRSLRVKAGIVGSDFLEADRRAVLNYGHTVGHAIELAAGIPHGHAVAIGMVAAGSASRLVTGFPDARRQRDLIESLGLPVEAPDVALSTVRAFMALDKKRRGEALRMVLLESIGRATVAVVDDATVRAALEAVGVG